MIVVSTGIAILPACNFSQEPLKVYSNLSLDQAQQELIGQLSKVILPTDGIEGLSTPEPTLDFILTMLNDSHSKPDIEKYSAGVTELQSHLKGQYKDVPFNQLPPEQLTEVIAHLSTGENLSLIHI